MTDQRLYEKESGFSWRRAAMLAAGLALAVAISLVPVRDAEASYGGSAVDSDGYVPVVSTCYGGYGTGYYHWVSDGYSVQGTIYVDDCLLRDLGAGPNDRAHIIAHEQGHAAGYGHSSDPYSVMYPTYTITGT